MGVWHSEDWSQISKKKRQWQRLSAAHKKGEVKKLRKRDLFPLTVSSKWVSVLMTQTLAAK
jgi:hypothetical protein